MAERCLEYPGLNIRTASQVSKGWCLSVVFKAGIETVTTMRRIAVVQSGFNRPGMLDGCRAGLCLLVKNNAPNDGAIFLLRCRH